MLTLYVHLTADTMEEPPGLAGWVIALIVMGILAFILLVAIIVVCICMRKSADEQEDEEKLKGILG